MVDSLLTSGSQLLFLLSFRVAVSRRYSRTDRCWAIASVATLLAFWARGIWSGILLNSWRYVL